MAFKFEPTNIPEVILIKSDKFDDERGFFMELYKKSDFENAGTQVDFVQDAYSHSKKGVIRGLHYQLPPKAQGKLVRVITGKIWDVAVDIRKSSLTFKKWVGVELNTENNYSLYIPPGFAHGFLALEDNTKVVYKLTNEYDPKLDRGIRFNDPELAIVWPVTDVLTSKKDAALHTINQAEIFD